VVEARKVTDLWIFLIAAGENLLGVE